MLKIEYKLLNENARAPFMANPGDACYDLYVTGFEQRAGVIIASTGVAMAIPEGYEGQIRARSGLAARGVFVVNGPGTIDSGYRGEIKVLLATVDNKALLSDFGKNLYVCGENLRIGDRIAQIAIREVPATQMVQVDELDSTVRGEGGFGSSGFRDEPVKAA